MNIPNTKIWTSGRLTKGIIPLVIYLLVISCSTTDKLPEDEQLYIGIKGVEYLDQGQMLFNDSLDATDNDLAATHKLTKAEKKALKAKEDKLKDEINTCKEEVEAVLDFAPNNALFGSSYVRFPIPFGLWSYNKYVDSQTKVQKV